MNSLVGYGVSSDSDSEAEGDELNTDETVRNTTFKMEVKKTRNFLLESGSASSVSDSESDQDEERRPVSPSELTHDTPVATQSEKPVPSSPARLSHKLPPPPLGPAGSRLSRGAALAGSSVFANPFKEQAETKLNALQKHVPLTLQARPSQIAGKRICVGYRKDGRCRFGSSCKFAHDSDLPSTDLSGDNSARPASIGGKKICVGFRNEGHCSFGSRCKFAHDVERQGAEPAGDTVAQSQASPLLRAVDETEGGQGRKRRVGLSDTLTPPKQAMKQYATQRERERVKPS